MAVVYRCGAIILATAVGWYGVDIEPACRIYEADGIEILIGDQSDRHFWAKVRAAVPRIDVLIDDAGHHPEHQIITLEELLPHLASGGVYLCEDVHGAPNYFASYVAGLKRPSQRLECA